MPSSANLLIFLMNVINAISDTKVTMKSLVISLRRHITFFFNEDAVTVDISDEKSRCWFLPLNYPRTIIISRYWSDSEVSGFDMRVEN